MIRRMKTDNPAWGVPRIHGELLQLGFDISEPTVSRYLHRLKWRSDLEKDPAAARAMLLSDKVHSIYEAAYEKIGARLADGGIPYRIDELTC